MGDEVDSTRGGRFGGGTRVPFEHPFEHPFDEAVLVAAVLPAGLAAGVVGAEGILTRGGRDRQQQGDAGGGAGVADHRHELIEMLPDVVDARIDRVVVEREDVVGAEEDRGHVGKAALVGVAAVRNKVELR